MLRQTKIVWVILLIAAMATTWTLLETAVAQKGSGPKPQDKLVLGADQVEQLLLLMDTDKNGKISKQEYMVFMEAEFDRLDKNKSGELDIKELKQSRLMASHTVYVGK